MLTVLRTVVDVQKVFSYTAQNALIVRAEADTMALVEKLIARSGQAAVRSDHRRDGDGSQQHVHAQAHGGASRRPASPRAVSSRRGPASRRRRTDHAPVRRRRHGTATTTPRHRPHDSHASTSIPLRAWATSQARIIRSPICRAREFEAVLNDSSTRVLQSPQIRAADNAKASIKIGDKVPTATGSFQPGVAGVGVSPLVNTQFTFLDVGVNVEILPHVHDNNEVSLHMDLDVSQVKDRIDLGGVSEPEISQNKATADVRLRDGEVNLIGGIIQQTDSEAITGIPGLANHSDSRAAVQRRKRSEGPDGTGDRDRSRTSCGGRISRQRICRGWRRAMRRRSRWVTAAQAPRGCSGNGCRRRADS